MRILIVLLGLSACKKETPKKIQVSFYNKVVDKLPIEFHPVESPYVRLNPGDEKSITYRFTNISPEKISIFTNLETERNSIQVIEDFKQLDLNEKESREVTFKFRIPSNIDKEKEKVLIKFLARRDD